jgi:hypothetical protein
MNGRATAAFVLVCCMKMKMKGAGAERGLIKSRNNNYLATMMPNEQEREYSSERASDPSTPKFQADDG